MNKAILVMSTQYPSYGGAGTNTYAIIKYLRKSGYNAIGIFIEDKTDIVVDPDKIGHIYRISWYPFVYNVKPKIIEYRKLFDSLIKGLPSLILCKNYFAPVCSKILYPTVKTIYLVSGVSCAIDICSNIPANQLISKNTLLNQDKNDLNAIKNSDLVVNNSQLSLDIFNRTFSEYRHKIYQNAIDTTKYISYLIDTSRKINVYEKKYDFIVVSSILTRREKNNLFLLNMFNNPTFNQYTKLIVGEDNKDFIDVPNSTVLDLIPHSELMSLMRQSKILLYPSLYDSNPNTIREANYNKCIVLISNNIGYYELFPEMSVCKSYDINEWITKSLYLVKNYYDLIKNYQVNLDTCIKDDLLDLISQSIKL